MIETGKSADRRVGIELRLNEFSRVRQFRILACNSVSLISIALITYARGVAYLIIRAHDLGSRDRRNFSVDRETD